MPAPVRPAGRRWIVPLVATVVALSALPFLARAQDEDDQGTPAASQPDGADAGATSSGATGSAPAPAGQVRSDPIQPPAASGPDVKAVLAPVIGNSWLFTRADSSLAVVDVATGQEVYARNADRMLQPASTMKVITSATALKQLGPAYRFTTDLFMDKEDEDSHKGEITPDGVLHGDLYVKGHGDPTFNARDLWQLIDDLTLAGVSRVDGSVIFDDSFHEKGTVLPGWDKQEDIDKGASYFSTLSALSVEGNVADMVVLPGAEVGQPARVALGLPVKGYIEIDDQIQTTGSRTRKFFELKREVTPDSTKYTLTGTIPIDDTARSTIRSTVADPTAYFMAAFHQMMLDRNIDVSGKYQRGPTPQDAQILVSEDSPPLSHIAADMNKSSINFYAEQVLRTVGAEVNGEGSTRAGLAVVSKYLEALGVPMSDIALVNGSGLSHNVRLKPSVLTRVLVDMAHDPQVGSEFASSLSISGTDGTLWARLRDDPGRLRGKTGTIDGVHCLSGYIDSEGGRKYAFAFLVNNYGTRMASVKEVHDQFARQLFHLGGAPTP